MERCSGRCFRRVAAGLAALLLASCAGATPSVTLAIRASYFPTQDFLPYLIMQDRGFDAAEGLQLDTRSFAGGAAAIAAMTAGALDLMPAVGTVPVLSAAERGLIPDAIVPIAANVFTDAEHRAIGVVVRPSVRSWRDLAGAPIAVNARDSITAAAVAGRLRREGVTDYRFVEIPFANMGLAIVGGNVAAAGMNEPFLTQSLLRGDGRLLDWVMGGGEPFPRTVVSLIAVSADFRRHHPEGVKAYLRAHLRAVQWINANPAEARRVLARRLDLTPDVGERFNMLRWPSDARNDPAQIDALQPVLLQLELLAAPRPARSVYDETLLEQALAETGVARR